MNRRPTNSTAHDYGKIGEIAEMSKPEEMKKSQGEAGALYKIFCIWTVFVLCRPQDYLTFLGILRPGLSLGLVLLFLFLLKKNQIVIKLANRQVVLYKCLIITFIFSIPFSYYPKLSLLDLANYSSTILLFYLFYQLINTIGKLRIILFNCCLGASVYALYALNTGSYNDNRLSFGEMFDSNDLAFFLVSFLTFNLIFMTKKNPSFVRIISAINIVISCLVILKSGSRGSLIALALIVTYMLFIKNRTIPMSPVVKAVLVVCAFISLQCVSMNTERYSTIMNLKDDYNLTDETGRIAIWKTGMKLMMSHPFTGVGFDRFPEGIGRDREARGLDAAIWQTAHNSLVQIGAEIGIVGFLLFCMLCLNAFTIFGQVAARSKIDEMVKIGEMARAGFLGHFVSAMFLSQAYSVYWPFYIVLSALLKHMLDKETEPAGIIA